jgi:uncharacterized membrane protein
MPLLILGVALWACVHLLPSVAPSLRAGWKARLGEQRYRGLFSLAIVASIALMVVGWRSSPFEPVYRPPSWGVWATEGGMLVALYLLAGVGSPAPSNVKRFLRHPQLTGIALWAGAHLLSRGDARSLVLFGGIGAWALFSMVFINRRDGAWIKPAAVPPSREVRPAAVGLVAYAVLFWAHPYFTAVAPPLPW